MRSSLTFLPSLGRIWQVRATDGRTAADDSGRFPRRDRAVHNSAAALTAELDPPVVAAARRLKAQPQAAALPLLLAARAEVIAETLEAAVQRPTPQCLLVGVELVLRRHTRAIVYGLVLDVAQATEGPTADPRCVVRRELEAEQTAAALRRERGASVLVPAPRRLRSASDAADFARAEARGEIQPVDAAAPVHAIHAPRGVGQNFVLQGIARTNQRRAADLIGGRGIGDEVRHGASLVEKTCAVVRIDAC